MSDEQIRKAIEKFNKKLPLIPEGEDRDLCLVGLENFQNELARRNQKKSESQPTGKTGELEETEKIKRAVLNPSLGIPALNETPEKLATDAKKEFESAMQKAGLLRPESNPVENKAFRESVMNAGTRVIGTVTVAPIITVPVVEIALSSGTKQMNRTEIITMLKTWFKRVATSKAMEEGRFSDAYGGAMGQDTWKLFNGWRMIYNETKEGTEYPPLLDCFPGYKNAKTIHKVNAEILWRWASNDK